MKQLQKVTILLKDSDESEVHNVQILEYLNDRYTQINDVGYAIAIDIVDDSNINRFIKKGITSIPALYIEEPEEAEYGVNAIIATLAKLEIKQSMNHMDSFVAQPRDDPEKAFRDMAMKEMMSDAQEDESSASSIRAKGQDLADRPPNEKDIDAKMSQYESYYSERKKRNPVGKKGKGNFAPAKLPSAKQNVEKLIADKGYDKGEAAFLREIARNLE
jgi:hypothetical protein